MKICSDLFSSTLEFQVLKKNLLKIFYKNNSDAKIIDVGGCWGWHWRNISKVRPDIKIFIVDFVKGNLYHAKNILKGDINQNVFLIHGDANDLIFDDGVFDGYWSVQTLQHIPSFKKSILEANRVLKKNGLFASYSLNNAFIIRFIYKLLGKEYQVKGNFSGYYLEKASQEQKMWLVKCLNSA